MSSDYIGFAVGGNIFSSPIVNKNNIYLTSEDNRLYAIDIKLFVSSSPKLRKSGYKSVDIIDISPNPFKDHIGISYKVNYKSKIIANITDINGIAIRNLFSGKKKMGRYSINWDGKNDSGEIIQNGLYFIEISSGPFYKNSWIQKIE